MHWHLWLLRLRFFPVGRAYHRFRIIFIHSKLVNLVMLRLLLVCNINCSIIGSFSFISLEWRFFDILWKRWHWLLIYQQSWYIIKWIPWFVKLVMLVLLSVLRLWFLSPLLLTLVVELQLGTGLNVLNLIGDVFMLFLEFLTRCKGLL